MEAASLAWQPLGWRCAFVSEIDKAPSALLAQRFPDVPNFGDMTKFEEWPDVSIDLLAGGTPCQSFSVAGLRRGIADPRGSLMLTYGAIAKRYRPTWLFWENVPGVLSSNGGRDFGAFLGMLAELGYGFAYRVLDAQFFGLAQRRKRVFVVGYLGDWRPPAAVLFERESLRGDSPPRRQAGERIAGTVAGCANGGGANGPGRTVDDADTLIAFGSKEYAQDAGDVSPPLRAMGHAALAFDARQSDVLQYGDMSGPLDTDGHTIGIQSAYAVRRLTPRECERLQGAPDDWTLVTYRGKPMADGPRYKMIGNSWAVPCVRWIGNRIAHVDMCLKAERDEVRSEARIFRRRRRRPRNGALLRQAREGGRFAVVTVDRPFHVEMQTAQYQNCPPEEPSE